MASRKGDLGGGGEKQGKIEIAYVKLEGNDATLQEAVKAFNALIARSSNGGAVAGAKRLNTLPAAAKTTTNGKDASGVVEDEAIDVDATEELDEIQETPAPTAPRAPRKYNVPTASPIDTESGVSVDAFVAQYKLESHEEKYLGIAGWLKTHRQQPLKAGLIVTLYKHLEWTPPADFTMAFRRLASKKYQWLERLNRGEYQIHQVGESKLAKLKV